MKDGIKKKFKEAAIKGAIGLGTLVLAGETTSCQKDDTVNIIQKEELLEVSYNFSVNQENIYKNNMDLSFEKAVSKAFDDYIVATDTIRVPTDIRNMPSIQIDLNLLTDKPVAVYDMNTLVKLRWLLRDSENLNNMPVEDKKYFLNIMFDAPMTSPGALLQLQVFENSMYKYGVNPAFYPSLINELKELGVKIIIDKTTQNNKSETYYPTEFYNGR